MAPFRPVLLGTDLGVYSIARSFHEAYGVGSIVVSNQLRGPIDNSRIIENVLVGAGAGEAETIAALREVARRHAGTPLLLIVNAEHEVEWLMRNRQLLERHYVIPYAPNEVLRVAGDKTALDAACTALGFAVPATQAVDLSAAEDGGWSPPRLELTFPVVLKPAPETPLASPETDKEVGWITSSASSPILGQTIALAMIRREVEPGDEVRLAEGGGTARVVELPFELGADAAP